MSNVKDISEGDKIEKEFRAMREVKKILDSFDDETRNRIMVWVGHHYPHRHMLMPPMMLPGDK